MRSKSYSGMLLSGQPINFKALFNHFDMNRKKNYSRKHIYILLSKKNLKLIAILFIYNNHINV